MHAVRRSVQYEMEILGDGSHPLQSAAKQRGEVCEHCSASESGALERGFVGARKNPGFVRNARSVGTKSNVVAAGFEHAQGLPLLLAEDVAEPAALFGDEVFASSAQFVKYAARNKQSCRDLRRRMAKLLPGARAEVFEEADIFNARVALEVEDALRGEVQKLFNLSVAGIPEMAVVLRILDDDLVRADGAHAVVEAVAAASGLTFDVVERGRMHYGARAPGRPA